MAKKVEVKSILMADQVIEAKDGKKSVIGIFDRILVRKLPSIHFKIVMFATLQGQDQEKGSAKIIAQSPTGKKISENELKLTYGTNGKADIIFNWEGFPIEEFGKYSFYIETEGKKLGEALVEVEELKEPNAGTSRAN